ncbi:MAG: diacylglycerol kinase family protein [Gammaproteobacteria bacterium]
MRKRIASFGYAFEGLAVMLRTQPNAWIHSCATVLVVGLGAWLGLPRGDWALLVVAITMVWVAEALNTGIEFLADAAVPDPHQLIKHAKDVAAGAVLLASVGAAVIGAVVFLPYLPV